jgi:asparagine synthase (glutamine-hydrolysing)
MPGVSLKCDFFEKNIESGKNPSQEIFMSALSSIVYNDGYGQKLLLNLPSYLVGCTKYAEYPIEIIDNDKFWICVEGRIYGKEFSVVSKEILDLMNIVFSNKSSEENEKKVIADWLLNADGEFVIYALDKKSASFVIINDVLGRLPLYYYRNDNTMIVSRETQFILSILQKNSDMDSRKFDKMGIAQYLLFGHTLGKRTLLDNIFLLEPASLIRLNNNDHGDGEVRIENIYRFNFEVKKYANHGTKKNAEVLVSLFSEACRNRASSSTKNMIALSGGFDSRAIAASFHKGNIPVSNVTCTDTKWTPVVGRTLEADIAKQLSKSLNMEWEGFTVRQEAKDLTKLLTIKNGLTLAESFLLRFLGQLKQKYNPAPITLFTGHGGDLLFGNLLRRKIGDFNRLARIVLNVKGFSISKVAALVGIKESEIVDVIKETLSSYPEKDLNQKLVHFVFYESNYKLSFELEDVYRYFFWKAAPFYSIPFFDYIMNILDTNKSRQALYREFLIRLSPSVAAIKNSNWGCSILSIRFRIMQYVLSEMWRHRNLEKTIKKLKEKKGYDENSQVVRCMHEQINNCDEISNYISREGIEKIMNNCMGYSRVEIDNLFTVTSLIEKSSCDKGIIEKYYSA